ncbi:MAG: hypothetical protein F9K10_04120, partial [Paludibacter sp.]
HLTWDGSPGEWTILRLGYTSTGRTVAPASDLGRGLECDKMNAGATEKHFNGYVSRVNDLSLRMRGKPLDFMQMESWEAGIQNWTGGFEKEFETRNGYSIIPWLPVMAGGRVVNSYEESNRFLWDLRRTISELMSENYWAVMHRLSNKKGISVLGEGSGNQHYLYDPILYHKQTDIPMGEFWTTQGGPRVDCKNAASVAHTYGKKLVAAEAFTGGDEKLWRFTPFDFKQIGDEAFTMGVNQFVLHSYVHQPYEISPGFTLSRFGNHFQRHNTWYKYANGWTDYLTRSQFMLRQGELVTDVCYFTGEGIPGYLGLRSELSPALPDGYDYDGVRLDKIREMEVVDGKLRLSSGISYHLMVVPETNKMSPELIREIARLVRSGATVAAARPLYSPSLSGYPESDAEVKSVADAIWGNLDGQTVKEHKYGKGRVVWGIPLGSLFRSMNVSPDFGYRTNTSAAKLNYIHRRDRDLDIYFVANNQKQELDASCFFRVTDKTPELWDAATGRFDMAPFSQSDSGMHVPLHFDPLGSVFIVFREPVSEKTKIFISSAEKLSFTEKPVENSWTVIFPGHQETQGKVLFKELLDWTENEDADIKYFSGTAEYRTAFKIKDIKSKRVKIDLGEVKNIAEVYI